MNIDQSTNYLIARDFRIAAKQSIADGAVAFVKFAKSLDPQNSINQEVADRAENLLQPQTKSEIKAVILARIDMDLVTPEEFLIASFKSSNGSVEDKAEIFNEFARRIGNGRELGKAEKYRNAVAQIMPETEIQQEAVMRVRLNWGLGQ